MSQVPIISGIDESNCTATNPSARINSTMPERIGATRARRALRRSLYISQCDWDEVLELSVLKNRKDYTGNAVKRLTKQQIIMVLRAARDLYPEFEEHISNRLSAQETRMLLKRVMDQG